MLKAIQYFYTLRSVWAVLLALVVGALFISLAGSNPVDAYYALFEGAFFDYHGFSSTLVKMSPILLAGLAVVLPLRAGLFNIGAEGQIYLGALFATIVSLYLPEMPAWLHVIAAIVAGMIGGALWALIPAILKAYYGINEVIVTLLMNYVGINIVSFFVGGPMMEEGAPYPYSEEIREELWLPILMPGTDAHIGALIGLVLAVVMYLVFKFTTTGFSLNTVGINNKAAQYAGIQVRRHILVAMMCGGALAGLAGAIEVLGLKYRLFHLFSDGYGYDGIIVAFLAGLQPILVPISALFLSGLEAGSHIMQRAVGVDSTVVEAIRGLVVIFVAAGLAFRFDRTYWNNVLELRKKMKAAYHDQAFDDEEEDSMVQLKQEVK
ncbi:MAG: ABC transporter permease [Motiliproteus sp.]